MGSIGLHLRFIWTILTCCTCFSSLSPLEKCSFLQKHLNDVSYLASTQSCWHFPFRQVSPIVCVVSAVSHPYFLTSEWHIVIEKRIKVENDSVGMFSSSHVNTLSLCPWCIHRWNHCFVLCTTLVHCRLAFVKGVMSLPSFNSHCVTRSCFPFFLQQFILFSLDEKKKSFTFCLPFKQGDFARHSRHVSVSEKVLWPGW